MADRKIIAVAGATGAQGGGLVRAILADSSGGFAARAMTRDVNSDKAKALAALGAEVVAADVDDADSIRKAYDGAYGAYCVTFFWDHYSPDREMAEAKIMGDAAGAAGLKHVLWSSLEDTRKWVPLTDDRMPTLHERFKVPHFDGKGAMNDYFRGLGIPVTIFDTAFYWENLIYFGMGPKKGPDGVLTLALPMGDARLPGIAAADIGGCAYGVFKKGAAYQGKQVGIAGDHPTGVEMAAALTKALGQPVRYQSMPFAAYRALGFPGADDLGNMFQFKHDFEDYYVGHRSLAESRALNPALQTFEQWAMANRDRIPTE